MTHARSALLAVLVATTALTVSSTPESQEASPGELTRFSQVQPGDALPAPWIHQTLPRVQRENRFDVIEEDGQAVLRVRSQTAASTLVHPLDVDPQETPVLTWRWQVSNVVSASDFTRKAGDDYAGRVYVLFDYPLERLALGERLRVALARRLHNAELPTAAIAYVWGTAQPVGATGPNAYTDRVQMIVVESGDARVGQWVTVRRDVAADFEMVFGEPAPRIVGIAVSADTDNTGEAVTTLFGDLQFVTRENAR